MNFFWAIFLSVENLYVHEGRHVALREWEWETAAVILHHFLEDEMRGSQWKSVSMLSVWNWAPHGPSILELWHFHSSTTKTATARASLRSQGSSHSSARSVTQGGGYRDFWTCTRGWTRWGLMQPDSEKEFVVSLPNEINSERLCWNQSNVFCESPLLRWKLPMSWQFIHVAVLFPLLNLKKDPKEKLNRRQGLIYFSLVTSSLAEKTQQTTQTGAEIWSIYIQLFLPHQTPSPFRCLETGTSIL